MNFYSGATMHFLSGVDRRPLSAPMRLTARLTHACARTGSRDRCGVETKAALMGVTVEWVSKS
jgi:hypothetical protein